MVSSTSGPSPRSARPSFTQVAASALAAMSAAVISSTFGVAGTLIGAAIASVVASVGSTLYLASLRSTNERLRRMAVAARRTDWSNGVATRPARGELPPPTVHEPELPFPGGEPAGQASEAIDAETPSGWSRLRWSNLRRGLPTLRRRWLAVAGLAVLVFAIAIGVLTAVGASTKQSAFPLGGSGGSGGSGKAPTAPASSPAKPTTSPTPTRSASPSPTAPVSPSTAATPSATPSVGSSASPGPGASSPAPSPSATPSVGTTPSPAPTPATVP